MDDDGPGPPPPPQPPRGADRSSLRSDKDDEGKEGDDDTSGMGAAAAAGCRPRSLSSPRGTAGSIGRDDSRQSRDRRARSPSPRRHPNRPGVTDDHFSYGYPDPPHTSALHEDPFTINDAAQAGLRWQQPRRHAPRDREVTPSHPPHNGDPPWESGQRGGSLATLGGRGGPVLCGSARQGEAEVA
ncbi:unnamed protein product [Vitrella brassicaformis CCMP3155]|uniref:Uncharacterized protein n=1 Tax=Vitrella brassicaformis (strain CCMP3155) TaxID=1169540 RepID=A0A0G4EDC9_VITBC|nr:unnamed protein product [Vitrella brassicaformis CCMP3155]|eukprot:CEL93354.1 unnamed protein product [Vitrella brassicaformis CCMP3155]